MKTVFVVPVFSFMIFLKASASPDSAPNSNFQGISLFVNTPTKRRVSKEEILSKIGNSLYGVHLKTLNRFIHPARGSKFTHLRHVFIHHFSPLIYLKAKVNVRREFHNNKERRNQYISDIFSIVIKDLLSNACYNGAENFFTPFVHHIISIWSSQVGFEKPNSAKYYLDSRGLLVCKGMLNRKTTNIRYVSSMSTR